jgi:hypothetical protein
MTKITQKNAAKIEATLKDANGKSEAHAFSIYQEIQSVADEAEASLVEMRIHRVLRIGAEFVATSSSKMPSAYKYSRNGTVVSLLRRATGWFLVRADPTTMWPSSGGDRDLQLSDAQVCRALQAVAKKHGFEGSADRVCSVVAAARIEPEHGVAS